MEQIKIDVQVRKERGSQQMKDLRKAGIIPGVVYGGGAEPANIQIARNEFERIMRQHEGESVIFHVHVQDSGKAVADFPALMREMQQDPVTDGVTHLDFQRISMDKEISIRVPVTLKGEAVGLKKPGATLEHLMRELEVICLPKNIPHHIELDVAGLDIHDSIHVRDVKLPAGVRTKVDPEATIVAVVFATRELEPAAVPGAEAAQPELEVIKEKPKEEKAAEGGAAGAAAKPAAGGKPEGGAKK